MAPAPTGLLARLPSSPRLLRPCAAFRFCTARTRDDVSRQLLTPHDRHRRYAGHLAAPCHACVPSCAVDVSACWLCAAAAERFPGTAVMHGSPASHAATLAAPPEHINPWRNMAPRPARVLQAWWPPRLCGVRIASSCCTRALAWRRTTYEVDIQQARNQHLRCRAHPRAPSRRASAWRLRITCWHTHLQSPWHSPWRRPVR